MTEQGWHDITRVIGGYRHVEIGGPGPRAAVALVLRDPSGTRATADAEQGSAGLELLFIRRAEDERDPWSGHVGFPGGRAEPADASLLATAIRETGEETALDLAHDAAMLGRLDDVRALARGRPVDLVITPFVFRLRLPVAGAPSHEAVSLHWLSIETLLDPASRSRLDYVHDGQTVALPCLEAAGLRIWGLTFRMFENFASVLRAGR